MVIGPKKYRGRTLTDICIRVTKIVIVQSEIVTTLDKRVL